MWAEAQPLTFTPRARRDNLDGGGLHELLEQPRRVGAQLLELGAFALDRLARACGSVEAGAPGLLTQTKSVVRRQPPLTAAAAAPVAADAREQRPATHQPLVPGTRQGDACRHRPPSLPAAPTVGIGNAVLVVVQILERSRSRSQVGSTALGNNRRRRAVSKVATRWKRLALAIPFEDWLAFVY